jgi:DNA-binding protein HU-beta
VNKTELVASVAEKSGLTKKDSEKAVNAVLAAITESMENGEKVQLVGFGTFEVRERKARKAQNPQTKEEITIPATKVPAFKAGKGLKDVVAQKN